MAYFRFFARLRAAPAATLMLSMRLGYARPALLARPFAAVFCKEESLRDIFPLLLRGFGRFQGVVFGFAMVCQRRGLDEVAWARTDFGTNVTWRG